MVVKAMTGPPTPWSFGAHGPLEPLERDLLVVRGDVSILPIGRIMTIVRLSNGALVVHSAVAGSPELMEQIDQLGPVRYVVVPSFAHKMDAPRYAARYPDALVLTPDLSRKKVEKVVAVSGGYDLLPADPVLSWQPLEGVLHEAVFCFRNEHGQVTLIFNDALMNLPDRLPGLKGWLTRAIGSTGGPKVTRTARAFLVKNPPAYGAHLQRLADTDGLKRIIVGHGQLIEDRPADVLRQVAQTLL